MELRARVALLDIEGTLGSIAFVRDVLFPFARERMATYLEQHGNDPSVAAILAAVAREAGVDPGDRAAVLAALYDWSDRDVKITPLKELQGLIWAEGFESSGIQGHLYPDAIDALRCFADSGIELYVYSSGSIAAQKLLFGHTVAGDLLPLFRGFFDTTSGGKRDAASYGTIARAIGATPNEIVFFSDVAAELDAAREAGMQTVQLARPQDGTVPAAGHASIASFDGIVLCR